ncbi:Fructokinase [hydrothermal vent metagenome]|uniref:Fructokinase n=1 Tax=hydrothermal vent metagenome TaxID=652676 RepID=A0A3B0YMZ2_9ZZZZ
MSVVKPGQPVIFGEVLFDSFADGSRVLGGAPFNVAWHLQAWGCTPLLISCIGEDDPGEQVRAAMQDWGMQTTGLQSDPLRPTGQVCVRIKNGEPDYDIVADQAYDAIDSAHLPDPEAVSLVYHGSLALRNHTSNGALDTLLERYHPPVVLDINLRPPWWDLVAAEKMIARASWLKLNEYELAELLQMSVAGQADVARLLQKYDLSSIIITQGEKGAYVYSKSAETFSVRPESAGDIVDTVGAGDAFTSVCILGLLQGWDIQQTLPRAQCFASAIVGVRGATVTDRTFYAEFISNWGLG